MGTFSLKAYECDSFNNVGYFPSRAVGGFFRRGAVPLYSLTRGSNVNPLNLDPSKQTFREHHQGRVSVDGTAYVEAQYWQGKSLVL